MALCLPVRVSFPPPPLTPGGFERLSSRVALVMYVIAGVQEIPGHREAAHAYARLWCLQALSPDLGSTCTIDLLATGLTARVI